MDTNHSDKVHSEGNQKFLDIDTHRLATRSTSSLSNSNSPRSSDHKGFKSNIPFPLLRNPQHLKNKNKSTVQFRTNQSVQQVKEERQQEYLESRLRHPKFLSDKLEFSGPLSRWNNIRVPRGKSVGALIRVQQQKQEGQVKIRHKYNTKVTSMIDKDEFNTGVRANMNQKIDDMFGSRVLPEQINSIAQIQQSKQGLSVSINMRSSLKQIVDEADPPERQKQQPHQKPIESIQQEGNDDQGNNMSHLRVSLQKLQGQQDLMKKIIRSQLIESNTENEPISSRVTESIMEQNQNQNQNEGDS